MGTDLSEITHHVQQANAALTALACGMRHDGVQTGNRELVLTTALDHIAAAYSCSIALTWRNGKSQANPLNGHENV